MITDPRLRRDLDWVLIGAMLVLCAIGVAFIHSARGGAIGGLAPEAMRQLQTLGLALVAMVVLLRIDYHKLVVLAPWAYGLGLVLLLAVFPFGTEIGGNKAWLRLGGFQLQPSEPMKVATLLLLASASARREARIRVRDILMQGVIVGVPFSIVALQDTGTALTFLPLLAASVFVGGLRWRWIIAAALALAMLAPIGWNQLKSYQKRRIEVVFNPDLDPMGAGYHAIQSRIAVGAGGLVGQGYLDGPQNRLGFLPARHTDFIFAIIAEEWGFIGAACVLGLYLLIIRRMLDAAALARDRLGAMIALGAMMLVSVHVLVNIGMVLGLLPTIGIPLPLISFGGSSLLAFTAIVALVLNVRMRRLGR